VRMTRYARCGRHERRRKGCPALADDHLLLCYFLGFGVNAMQWPWGLISPSTTLHVPMAVAVLPGMNLGFNRWKQQIG
jgi:hypothetical protein